MYAQFCGYKAFLFYAITTIDALVRSQLFSVLLAFIYAAAEIDVVSFFFLSGLVEDTSVGFFYSIVLLVGVGTFIHFGPLIF